MVFDDDKIAEIARAFFDDGKAIANEVDNLDNRFKLMQATVENLKTGDSFVSTFKNELQKGGKTIDCKKGCSCCCNQTVFALNYEIEVLFKWLRDKLSYKEMDQLKDRVIERWKKSEGADKEKATELTEPCPLLVKGSCIGYNARPMACRIIISSDKESCEKQMAKEDGAFADYYQLPLRAGQMLNEGFAFSLKRREYEVKEISIEEGLKDQFIKNRL